MEILRVMRSHVLRRRLLDVDDFLPVSSLSPRTVLDAGLALELVLDP